MQADIVIVGAGMVGSLLAASLQHLSLNIVVIDQIHATEPNNQAPYEPRVSALTRASQNMLTHVGAWSLVKQKRYAPFSTMQVREQEGHGDLSGVESKRGEWGSGVVYRAYRDIRRN